MPAGFQVFTHDGNVLQIDDESIVYSLRRSGQITMNYDSDVDDFLEVIDITGTNNPIVAVRCSSPCSAEIIMPKGQFINPNGYYTRGRRYLRFTGNVSGAEIQYYLFDQWTAPRGNSGIEIYDSNGNVVYHSDWYLMDVVDFLNVPAGNPTRSNIYTAGSVGNNRAIAKTLNRVWTQAGQGGAPLTHKEAVSISGGQVRVSYVEAGSYGNSAGYSYLQKIPNKLIVIDTSRLPATYG